MLSIVLISLLKYLWRIHSARDDIWLTVGLSVCWLLDEQTAITVTGLGLPNSASHPHHPHVSEGKKL